MDSSTFWINTPQRKKNCKNVQGKLLTRGKHIKEYTEKKLTRWGNFFQERVFKKIKSIF